MNDKWAEKEMRETAFFTISKNNIKCLVVTLTKKVKDLYDKNFKSLKKEVEEDIKNWKDLPCSRMSWINIVIIVILPRTISKSTQTPKFQHNSLQTLKGHFSTLYGKPKNIG